MINPVYPIWISQIQQKPFYQEFLTGIAIMNFRQFESYESLIVKELVHITWLVSTFQ